MSSNRSDKRRKTAARIMALILAVIMVMGVGVYIFIMIGGGS